DRAVIFRRGVEVMVVIVEAGCLEPPRLALREHAERGAGLEPDRFDGFDHRADLLEVAVLRLTPRRAHAEAARPPPPPPPPARAWGRTTATRISFAALTPVA